MTEGGSIGERTDQGQWDIDRDGHDQLRELYAMERNQDLNLWTSSAIFAAANSVLAVGFFQQEEHYLARLMISLIGLMVTSGWFVVSQRSHQYEVRWIDKAKELQKRLGVPLKYSVWDEEPPPGFSARRALNVVIFGFSVFWAIGIVFGAINWLF